MRNILGTWLLTLFSLTVLEAQVTSEKPNIIVLLVDDLGWGDIGYNNPENVYTPNMDKLAATGATLLNHYSMPQCTPTRIATFTGRYPGRFGNSGLQATNVQVFPVGTPTLATMLKKEGYRTYISGKWHMGCEMADGPMHHGFDESYGSMGGAVGMYDHRYRPKNKYAITWHRNQQIIDGYENGAHVTDLVTREAQRIVQIKDDKPFFLFLTYHAPHTPLDERGDFIEQPTKLDTTTQRWINEDKIRWFNDPEGKIQREKDPEKRLLLAAVNHLDFAIGELIKTLDQTGKRDNTIILFSSDNGPQGSWSGNAYPDDLHLTNFNQPIPMRGKKVDVWEGGIHVPGFINWPGKIKTKEVKDVVHVIDWFPTLANLVGHQETEGYALDGKNLSGIIFNEESLNERELYWIWNAKTNRWALRFGDWKIVKYGTGEPQLNDWQLFYLKEDPKETVNVASKHRKTVKKLHNMFLKQRLKDKQI